MVQSTTHGFLNVVIGESVILTDFNLLAHGNKIIRSFCIMTEDGKLLYNSNGVLWLSARFTGSFGVSVEIRAE